MIEKGIDPMIFRQESRKRASRIALRIGFIAIGVGLGTLLSFILSSTLNTNNHEYIPPMSIFMMTGLALVFSFNYERKLDKDT